MRAVHWKWLRNQLRLALKAILSQTLLVISLEFLRKFDTAIDMFFTKHPVFLRA
jgi:hypothetical protein